MLRKGRHVTDELGACPLKGVTTVRLVDKLQVASALVDDIVAIDDKKLAVTTKSVPSAEREPPGASSLAILAPCASDGCKTSVRVW